MESERGAANQQLREQQSQHQSEFLALNACHRRELQLKKRQRLNAKARAVFAVKLRN